ncbi:MULTISPECIES: SMP-30/gluconolactonase/LRE family protein [Actinoalloteichus]|uniref:NHL repeat protein,gluconolactonase family protein n=1 Tax=Actinoalloteichus fjordicus TaxID=1612552 RepID=A0AAC9LHV1_9PSEU|nr:MULTISPECIES: SMP-30/gluconolactonase/LRE family protein [Actinoalloteichus]APU16645.1 NHL repeat protein,gluconolactonase family protein [Actinoalloteichus fjordicus]APU22711.1 NHL repeat protein,gluconolactonase family protein [Actinoalloteichus sp. GBA129-24]
MTSSTTVRPGSTGTVDAVVTTVAGSGIGGFGEDADGRAVHTRLHHPTGVTIDMARKILYIADSGNHRVRRVHHGSITTVAGTGDPGFDGDGGPADAARVTTPTSVAVDHHGTLYIADTGNHRIRKVDTDGTITTVAGTGDPGFDGDGGPANAARVTTPTSVAVDHHGTLYIADTGNHRIRKVDTDGTITTVAGAAEPGDSTSRGGFSEPVGVAVDRAGSVYVAERGAARVSRIGTTGLVTVIAGAGAASDRGSTRLSRPNGVAVDGRGAVYIADTGCHRIRKVTSGIVDSIAGTGSPGRGGVGGRAVLTPFDAPNGVALDEYGNMYVADTGSHRIRKIMLFDRLLAISGDGQRPAPAAVFPRPLVVRVTLREGPVLAAPITFAIVGDTTSGARFTESASTRTVVRTNLQGEAAVELTGGPMPGTVRVEATLGTMVTTFTAAISTPKATSASAR